MEHEYWRRGRDERRLWAPLAIVGGAFLALLLALIVVFRDDEDAGSTPVTRVSTSAVPTSPPATTTAPTPPRPIVVAPRNDPPPDGGTLPGLVERDAATALERVVDELRASDVTEIVPIGSGSYALVTIAGSGRLLRWDGEEWVREANLDPPGSIRSVETVDVTDDGVLDFIVTLSGLQQPGGVFSRATFAFDWLPFATPEGPQDFVDQLQIEPGELQSTGVDSQGRPATVSWQWTGQQFAQR